MRRIFLFLILTICTHTAFTQSTYVPLNEDYHHWVDRYEIKTGRVMPNMFTGMKPYKRSEVVSMLDSIGDADFSSSADQFNYEYLMNDNWEWSRAESSDSEKPVLRHFYKKKSDLFHVDEKWFDLHVNPVLYLSAGKDSRLDDPLYVNTRGVEVRGMVDKKVGFYTYLSDNQALLPSHAFDYLAANGVIPHEGFWKIYKDGPAVDFLQARGYITFPATRHISMQFGHDRNFIGNGYRSLITSDFGPPTWFIKGNVKVWKINYLFLLNQMVADVTSSPTGLIATSNGYPNKFSALHHLSINIGKKFTLGIFESVIFSPDDATGTDHFRLDYLNPIIFYRAIEQQNGSSDNVLLGFDFKYNPVRKLSFYGQFLLDEFVISHIRAQDGWWANKFGVQFGGKYIDAFSIPNLDLQGEINIVRPFTYSHGTEYGDYSSYRQPIAHPLGANFREAVGILRYQPLPRLNITGKLALIQHGKDRDGKNWGGDILKRNIDLAQQFGNKVGQGLKNNIMFGSFTASWHLKHNLFIDGTVILRKSESDLDIYNTNASITTLALRWNIAQRLYEF